MTSLAGEAVDNIDAIRDQGEQWSLASLPSAYMEPIHRSLLTAGGSSS